jgi:sorbitol/mannitol transport system permease protein
MAQQEVNPQKITPGIKRKSGKSLVSRISRTKMHIPAILYLVVLTQIPFVYALWISLHSWNLLEPSLGEPFVGLANYSHELFVDPDFWPVVANTAKLIFGSLIVSVVAGTVFALLLHRAFRGRNLLRTIILIPFLITPAVSAIVWKNLIFSSSFGLLGWLVKLFGGVPIPWLSQLPMVSVIILTSWEWTPFFILVLIAGLQSVPDEVIEAAQMDGAGPASIWWHIMVPFLEHYYEVAVLLGTIFIFQTFGKLYIATGGGPGIQTTTLPYYTYKVAFQYWQVGQAATIGVFGVILAILLAQLMVHYITKGTQGVE